MSNKFYSYHDMGINRPNADEVQKCLGKFLADEYSQNSERGLRKLFKECFPANVDIGEVLMKVCALNSIYNTNIFKPINVAEHIVAMDIDEELGKGNINLVEKIASVKFERGQRVFYSFATKYCSFHQPHRYPIYDSYIDQLLWNIHKTDDFASNRWGKREELRDYKVFYDVVCAFREIYGLGQFSFKEIDIYLWTIGKSIFSKYKPESELKNDA